MLLLMEHTAFMHQLQCMLNSGPTAMEKRNHSKLKAVKFDDLTHDAFAILGEGVAMRIHLLCLYSITQSSCKFFTSCQ
jgi:hypothetical protein